MRRRMGPGGRQEYLARPRVGLITAWPGDVPHRVLPYAGQEERIILACNVRFAPRPRELPADLPLDLAAIARRNGLSPTLLAPYI